MNIIKIMKDIKIKYQSNLLLNYLPFSYKKLGIFKRCDQLIKIKENTLVSLVGELCNLSVNYSKHKYKTFYCILTDDYGICQIEFFSNLIAEIKEIINSREKVICHGTLQNKYNKVIIYNPHFLPLEYKKQYFYPLYRKVKYQDYKHIINEWKNNLFLECFIDLHFLEKHDLWTIEKSLQKLHFPDSHNFIELKNEVMKAINSLATEELIAHCLQYREKFVNTLLHVQSYKMNFNDNLHQLFIQQLSFHLTPSQEKALENLRSDLMSPSPVYRLIQGDVGSGKTIILMMYLIQVSSNNLRAVLLAPTLILAQQHFINIQLLMKYSNLKIFLLSGHSTPKQRILLQQQIDQSPNCIIIGTHTLLGKFELKNVGIVIIDEQQKFGALQRTQLIKKTVTNSFYPHVLLVSATPIPRTILQSLSNIIQITHIEYPPQKKKVKTYCLLYNDILNNLIPYLKQLLKEGNQIYWVCPRIEKYFEIRKQFLHDYLSNHIILLHGKMTNEEKLKNIEIFKNKKAEIMLCTSIIETGIDIPNANIIVVDDPGKLGLAQLHQLRGRVGRGKEQGLSFFLYGENSSIETQERLKILNKIDDGIVIAKYDMFMRGGGSLIGSKQSGQEILYVSKCQIHLLSDVVEEIMKNCNKLDIEKIKNRWL
jgi:ATP-dependent DNA helicase RecG